MVEMNEAKDAICNATKNSLILFDELGRGTATFDGMSLAKAILEYISKEIKCKTLFSTHYHEITSLEKEYKNIKNVHVSAIEEEGKLTFLHKVKNGSIDKSYGIHVAKLANMPDEIINNANKILSDFESKNHKSIKNEKVQLSMDFGEQKQTEKTIKEALKDIDPLNLTPIEALNILFELKKN